MGCAKAWTPVEMLEDLLREAADGSVDLAGAIVIFPGQMHPDDDVIKVNVRKAGINSDDEMVMLRAALRESVGL